MQGKKEKDLANQSPSAKISIQKQVQHSVP
jgi:hypothetical protein